MSASMISPLEPRLGSPERLPTAFQMQFLTSPDAEVIALADGVMDTIWFPHWLAPLFWLLGKTGILVPVRGRVVPTTLEVIPRWDAAHKPIQDWNRTFRIAPEKVFQFNTRVTYDDKIERPVDLVGTGRRLHLIWDVRFHPPDTLTILRENCAIQIGGRQMWLPRWMWMFLLGRERFTQIADPDNDRVIHIELIIEHPLLGDIFIYRGTFEVSLQARHGAADG